MRGIMSEGMIMCASSPDLVEIIDPPPGAAVGDHVTVDGYIGEDWLILAHLIGNSYALDAFYSGETQNLK